MSSGLAWSPIIARNIATVIFFPSLICVEVPWQPETPKETKTRQNNPAFFLLGQDPENF